MRLLSLLDKREYDRIDIIASERDNSRSQLARIIAKIAESSFNANVHLVDPDDLEGNLMFLQKRYKKWYRERGFNFECGLTGSKIEAIACAVASTVLKFSQCWYVRPQKMDPKRFSLGVGGTEFYEISIPDEFSNYPANFVDG